MTIHILPSERRVDRRQAETTALFLVREAVNIGATKSPTFVAIVDQLARSTNAAIAKAAMQIKGAVQ